MATGPGINQGKTAFVTRHVRRDPDASDKEINRAWTAGGTRAKNKGS